MTRVEQLEAAIRKHRDQRGDDRCWLDDQELYQILLEPIPESAGVLPPKEVFLANCERYHQCRKRAEADTGISGQWITKAELELMELRIRDQIAKFLREVGFDLFVAGKVERAELMNRLAKRISDSLISLEQLNPWNK